jgi:hypothetical protein
MTIELLIVRGTTQSDIDGRLPNPSYSPVALALEKWLPMRCIKAEKVLCSDRFTARRVRNDGSLISGVE